MKHILSFFVVLTVATVFAQPASYIISNNNNNMLKGIANATAEGNIVSASAVGGKLLVSLFNQQNSKVWEKEVNLTNAPTNIDIFSTSGVNLSLIGNTIHITNVFEYFDSLTLNVLIKTYSINIDMSGNVLSIKSITSEVFTNNYYGEIPDAIKFVTDSYGNIYKSESFYSNGRLTKYLSNGNFGWYLDFGGNEDVIKHPIFDLECKGDSEIVVIGRESGFLKLFTIRPNGTIKKANAFQSVDYNIINSRRIHRNTDGTYILTGFATTTLPNINGFTPILIKLNKDLMPVKEITIGNMQIDVAMIPTIYDIIETSDYYYFSGVNDSKSIILKMKKDFSNIESYSNPAFANFFNKVTQSGKEFFVFQSFNGTNELAIVDPTNLNGCDWIENTATTENRTPSTIVNELYFSNLITTGPAFQNEAFTVSNSNYTTIYKTCTYETQVSLEEQNDKSDFATFPNPVENEFILETNLGSNSAVATLFDVMGRVILTQNINADLTSFNTSSLPAGMYILKVSDKSGKMLFHNKMVKAAH